MLKEWVSCPLLYLTPTLYIASTKEDSACLNTLNLGSSRILPSVQTLILSAYIWNGLLTLECGVHIL